jgi:hypothetical protein
LNYKNEKSTEDYDHHEYDLDDSEKIEWEEHYENRNRKWRKVDEKDEQLSSKHESMESVDINMEDET